jgi:hypothetical protein
MLYPGESFLSFKFTPTFTVAAGIVRLDSSAFSLISSIRLYHGSNKLVNIKNFGDLAAALLDVTSAGSRTNFSNTLGCSATDAGWGIPLNTNVTKSFTINLPIPLLGSMSSDSVLLLGWMGAGDLRLVIEFQTFEKSVTTQVLENADDRTSVATACTLTNFVLSDVYYSAKVSRLSPTINQQLIKSHQGRRVTIAAVDHRCESIHVGAGASTVSARLNYQFKSLKHILWWSQDQGCDQGIPPAVGHNGSGTTQRFSNELKSYDVDIDGMQVPSGQVQCGHDGATLTADYKFPPSIPMQELAGCYNVTDQGNFGMSDTMFINSYGYSNKLTMTSAGALEKKTTFIGALDLELAGGDTESVIFAGTDTKNSAIHLHIAMNSNIATAQTLRLFSHHDVLYTLENGTLVKSD